MATDESLQKAIQVWCKPETSHLNMIAVLTEAFADILDEIKSVPVDPLLGLATTKELLDEVYTRIEMDGMLEYRTVDSESYNKTPTTKEDKNAK